MSDILVLVYEEYARDARVRRHCRLLVGTHHRVEVVAVGDERSQSAARQDGVRLTALKRSKYRGASRWAYLTAYAAFTARCFALVLSRVWRRAVDLVYVNNPPDFLVLAAWPARVRKVPVVLDVHDMTSDLYAAKFGVTSRFAGWVIGAVERFSFRSATGLVTIHDLYRERIELIVGEDVPVAAVLNVPDNEAWLSIGDRRSEEPRSERRIRLGHHGTIVERFGLDLAVEAVAGLRAEGAPVSLSILGNGDFADEIERRIDELHAGEWISFDRRTFSSDELVAFTDAIDVGVAPYRPSRFSEQGMPTKVLEYLALGIPTIVTETRMVRTHFAEVVRIIRGDSVTELQDAIREMLEPSVRRRYRVAGRRVAYEYSWSLQRQRLLDLTDLLLANAQRAKP